MQTATVLFLVVFTMPAPGQGTIKGRLAWPDKVEIPENRPIKVAPAFAGRRILRNQLIIDPRNRGIKNAVFFLVDAENVMKPLPLTPAVKKALPKTVTIDAPAGEFTPRLVVVAPGQTLTVMNSSMVPYNLNIIGGAVGPNVNSIIPPKGKYVVEDFRPRLYPIPYCCTIHAWMKGYVIASPSPYAAVTDANGTFEIKHAPKGKYKLVGWHEEIGWIFPAPRNKDTGLMIEISDGKTTDIGKLERKD